MGMLRAAISAGDAFNLSAYGLTFCDQCNKLSNMMRGLQAEAERGGNDVLREVVCLNAPGPT